MNFEQTNEFTQELKKLQKKWRSLPNDLSDAMLQISRLYLPQDGVDLAEYRSNFFNGKRATILQILNDGREVIKMSLDVESLGTGSKVRVVFIAVRDQNKIIFVELFTKSDKNREDVIRLKKYL